MDGMPTEVGNENAADRDSPASLIQQHFVGIELKRDLSQHESRSLTNKGERNGRPLTLS
jgi:hypothetical protein